MTVVAEPSPAAKAPLRRLAVMPAIELAVLALAIVIGIASWQALTADGQDVRVLTPPLAALLLIANLMPGIALMALIGRRIALRRARRSAAGGEGLLHVRLVGLFSVLATVPVLLLTVFASILFQSGLEFWSSPKARGMLENAQTLARQSYQEMLGYVDKENVAMAADLSKALVEYRWAIDSRDFAALFAQDVYQRSLSEAVVFTPSASGGINTFALVNPYDRALERDIDLKVIQRLQAGERSVVGTSSERTRSVTRIPGTDLFLYAARVSGAQEMSDRMNRAQTVVGDYRALLERSQSLQLRFNVALLLISLAIVGIAIFVALAVADRLVRPVGELVDAAARVAGGDLSARVPVPRRVDEIGTLATAFNRMTERLGAQTGALVEANAAIENRRALIEAVLAGVTAGVIAVGHDRAIRLANNSAAAMLGRDGAGPLGRPLAEIAPELDQMLASGAREGIVQVAGRGEARTLAVKINRDGDGHVLTFDDITQQLIDQRRAAWSDVARRIAHEIKNPLTPIQLAAERLQRRYGKLAPADDTTFGRLTDTIVRQVGDLRRMVDEFSSFARMPKPVFREESLVDLVRQTLFLHEVAHPAIRFMLAFPDPLPTLVCDRRQLGQALTNLVKNSVEAIEARKGDDLPQGILGVTMEMRAPGIVLTIVDNGIGLPVERDRIVEPYMTTRKSGTGLGLAIVKKIVEEHFGTMAFSDRDGGGTVVTLTFDATMLAGLAQVDDAQDPVDPSPAMLTRNTA